MTWRRWVTATALVLIGGSVGFSIGRAMPFRACVERHVAARLTVQLANHAGPMPSPQLYKEALHWWREEAKELCR